MTKLVVQGLCKEFETTAEKLSVLDDINFELSSGENLSIVGPSGCGKSTLLYILGTLDSPTAGTIMLDDVDPFKLPAAQIAAYRNESVGFIFQDHHLLPQLTVTENVLIPAMAIGAPSQEQVQRAGKLIADVGLAERADHVPGQLSGGERQRVAVARALLNRPKLLLADEPTGNLDQSNTEKIAELLFDLPSKEGALLIVVTHSNWLAERASRQMRLENHQLIQANGAQDV